MNSQSSIIDLNPSRRNMLLTLGSGIAPHLLLSNSGLQATEALVATNTLPSTLPPLVTKQTHLAIQKGLKWVAQNQNRDGSWRSMGTSGRYPTAMSSLCGLALLAGGHTPTEGLYTTNVRRAISFLLRSRNPSGLIARMEEERSVMHGHGFAMLFLAEAYGMERSPAQQKQIHQTLTKAIQLTGQSQSRHGGWLYQPNSSGDEGSVTVTQIQGLRACRNAGIHVPKSIITRAIEYIAKSANSDGGIRYSISRGSSRPALTAAAVATLYNAGAYDHPIAAKCMGYLEKYLGKSQWLINRSGHEFYMLLYTGQATYLSGDQFWKRFYIPNRDRLLQNQSPTGSWSDYNGTAYATSIALLTLLLPYANLPILQR